MAEPTIESADLVEANVPPIGSDWSEIARFARTFNGYKHWGSFEKCAEIANAPRHESLDDLRTCLFFEERRWHHFGDEPDADAIEYIREVVEKIRRSVSQLRQGE